MGFVWPFTNLEHSPIVRSALSVSDITNDDLLEVVDRYPETTTGYCAARVHDTDLQTALLALPLRDDVVHGVDVALPAGGGYTAVTDWIDVRSFSWFTFGFVNTGAQPVTNIMFYNAIDAAGTGGSLALGSGVTIGAGLYGQLGNVVVNTAFTFCVPQLWVRGYAASTNGTTCRARCLRRRGGF